MQVVNLQEELEQETVAKEQTLLREQALLDRVDTLLEVHIPVVVAFP